MADYLVDYKKFKKYAIAESLKEIVAKKYNIDHNLTLTQDGKSTITNTGFTVRDLLIKAASDLKKSINIDVFITDTCNKIANEDIISMKLKQPLLDIVISDFRYINEYNYIRKKYTDTDTKVLTVRINRFNKSPIDSDSETQLDKFKFDYYYENKASIFAFYYAIEEFIRSL